MARSPFGEDTLSALAPLLREVVNLKRVRTARSHPQSLAERLFLRAWGTLLVQEGPGRATEAVMLREGAGALVATRLAGVDARVMGAHGLSAAEQRDTLRRAFREAAAPVDDALARRLEDALLGGVRASGEGVEEMEEEGEAHAAAPPFAEALLHQPRAGVTCPGKERLMLTPTESHADHCASVAVMAALLAPHVGADPAEAFFIGLAHHIHNASLPDAGHAGDVLLGDAKAPLLEAARERTLGALPEALAERVRAALAQVDRPPDGPDATPLAECFHAADALDRVLEINWHARTARFTMEKALGEMNLVHEGPEQAFQEAVLREAGVLVDGR